MLRISKLADYGTQILLVMAGKPDELHKAPNLAIATRVPVATVSKILKRLQKAQLLLSQRGSQGGYRLAQTPDEINLVRVVAALDGDIAMTECGQKHSCCDIEQHCTAKNNWSVITQAVNDVLSHITLTQMLQPLTVKEVPVVFQPRKVSA